MNSTLNFSTINHSKSKKNQISLKHLTNQSSKSYFSSNPTDQSNIVRSVRSKDHKYTTSSHSRSKIKDEAIQSNRIINENIKYPPANIDKTTVKKKEEHQDQSVLSRKILDKAIDQLFKYMKAILPKETYDKIKSKFQEDLGKLLSSTINQDDSTSSIISLIKSPWCINSPGNSIDKNLKLSYEFLPSGKENNANRNNHSNYNSNTNTTHNLSKQNSIHQTTGVTKGIKYQPKSKNNTLYNDKKHSLYSLTKGKVIHQTRSNSKSQSNSREHSVIMNKCGGGISSNVSLGKANMLNHKMINQTTIMKPFSMNINHTNATTTANNYRNTIKKSIITKTQCLLNTKLFSKLQNDLLKMENSKNCSLDKQNKFEIFKNVSLDKNDKANKLENSKNHSSEKILMKGHNSKKSLVDKPKTQSYRNDKEKENEKEKEKEKDKEKEKKIIKIGSGSSGNNMNDNNDVNVKVNDNQGHKEEYIPKKSSKRKRDNSECFNDTNDIKNSEQLKEIKSSLDDNLKVMLSFSYESFLNRESESESKRSMDDISKREGERDNKITYSYKKKYKY